MSYFPFSDIGILYRNKNFSALNMSAGYLKSSKVRDLNLSRLIGGNKWIDLLTFE